MENVIRFETAPRPLYTGRSNFPYEEIMKSLEVLDSTSSVVLSQKECKTNNITYLSAMVTKSGSGRLRSCSKNGKVYLWIQT